MRKTTRGRKIVHIKINQLKGTAIMINIGSPRLAATHNTVAYEEMPLRNGETQTMNCLRFLPFERHEGKNLAEDMVTHSELVESVVWPLAEKNSGLYPHEVWQKSSYQVNYSLK